MKKIKLIIIFLIVFLVSGCTAEYNVEIYNDEVRVDGSFVEEDTSKWEESIYDIPYYEVVEWKTTGDSETPVADGIYKISDNTKLGIGLKNTYNLLDDYVTSPGLKACYQYFNVIEENDEIIISTSTTNKCFDEYSLLDTITVNLKTNHKVVSSNADIVNGYHYTWNLDRYNKDDAVISLVLKKDEYVFNYENEFIKKTIYIVGITGIILIVGGTIYIHYKNKNRRLNEI